ncbi:protein translocase subunit SecD [Streptomyces rectiverticillatus]|uniref:protein translocase subunit SecD n=1 Tax=Streptomyces rectiverticillatus TaxID=173860 RepID=UPI0015C33ECF|nr:protein translocase subunit SecD [Streptomyces rectiverticillatus]QLE70751.1 protein translocase subunit SecD [Streptomyces rectiverticillatus]
MSPRPSRRAPLWRALVALAVVAASLFFALTTPARLGLDLRGGTQIVLETRDSPTSRADAAATDRALEVLRQRVDALGVAEPSLARSGERRIVVELPGVQDPRKAVDVIGRTAQLTFHPVLGTAPDGDRPPAAADGAAGARTLPDPDAPGHSLRLGPAALTGKDVKDARAVLDAQTGSGWTVALSFRGGGEKSWARVTGEAACAAPGETSRRVAIVLDDRVVSAPAMQRSVPCRTGIQGGSAQITGGFDDAAARDLAALVKGGALPVPVEVVEQRTVGPTLGAEAIRASAGAAVIGLVCTALFVIAVYRLLGVLATVALALYGLISYAALVALGATLTLPGLAGFVLAVGMAVDANVLVFERTREEYERTRVAAARRSGPQDLCGPLRKGFGKAWSAVVDSNVTTLLAAGLLFFFATGPVKGFGVTLSVGVAASMISALVITRVLADWALRHDCVRRRPRLAGVASTGRMRAFLARRGPRLMHYRRIWLGVSAALLALAVAGLGARGLQLGVEFTGGRLVEYGTSRPVDVEKARAAVGDAGFPRAVVQKSGNGDVVVRTGAMDDGGRQRIQSALEAHGGAVTVERDERIGPSLGSELRDKALIALGVAVAAQLVYLSVRFRWTFATAAVAAMVQDVLLVAGLFAWLGRPADSVFLAALLTVVGYSVNDTVVVFDRIRETRRPGRAGGPGAGEGRTPLASAVDSAILHTVPRTVNTGMGVLFVLAALAVLGGDSLADFSLALLAGVLFGIGSTVLTAAPIAVILEEHRPAAAPPASPAPRKDPRDSGAVV